MDARPQTYDELKALLPESAIEEVGDRKELVIYTGLAKGGPLGTDYKLIPMPEGLD